MALDVIAKISVTTRVYRVYPAGRPASRSCYFFFSPAGRPASWPAGRRSGRPAGQPAGRLAGQPAAAAQPTDQQGHVTVVVSNF